MAVTQYIGARYVLNWNEDPTWKQDQAYEPLWMVLYQGNTYISRQAVPAGTEITNTQFWTRFADFNAQIEQYRSDVARLSSQVSGFSDSLAGETKVRQDEDEQIRKDIAANKKASDEDIAANKKAIEKNAEDIAANKKAIEKNAEDIAANKKASDEQADRIAVDAISAGADATGAADSAPALNAALQRLGESGGGELLLPPGTYTVKSPLVLYSNVRIQGSGAVIQADLTGEQENHAALYWHGSGDDTLHNVRIRDVKITSKTTPANLSDAYDGVRIIHDSTVGGDRKVGDIVIDGCSFEHIRYGVFIRQGGDNLDSSVFAYATLSNCAAINTYGAAYLKNCIVSVNQLTALTSGNCVEARSSASVTIDDSYLDSLQSASIFAADTELMISNSRAYSRVENHAVVEIESASSSDTNFISTSNVFHSDHDYDIRLYTEHGNIYTQISATWLSNNLSGGYSGPIRIVGNQESKLKLYWSASNKVTPQPDTNWITQAKEILQASIFA